MSDYPFEDDYYGNPTLKSQRDYMGEQLVELWKLTHRLVETHRNVGEIRQPQLYKYYDAMCERYGETSRQVKIDTSKQK